MSEKSWDESCNSFFYDEETGRPDFTFTTFAKQTADKVCFAAAQTAAYGFPAEGPSI
jgi:hypothetical protein